MRVEEIWREGDRGKRESLLVVVDGVPVFAVQAREVEEAHPSRCSRDCDRIVELMERAHAAGGRGEPFVLAPKRREQAAPELQPWQLALEKAINEGSTWVLHLPLARVANCAQSFFTTYSAVSAQFDTGTWHGDRWPELVERLWQFEGLLRVGQKKSNWGAVVDRGLIECLWPGCRSERLMLAWTAAGKLVLMAGGEPNREIQSAAFEQVLHEIANARLGRGG